VSCGLTTGSTRPLRLRGQVSPPSAATLVADRVATGSSSRASRLRAGGQAAVGAAGWLLLAFLWLWQFQAHHVPSSWAVTIAAVAGGVVVFAALCLLWVGWNRNIYGRRHNRRTPIVSEIQFERDALGRTIVIGDGRRDAAELVVTLDGAAALKHYVLAST
jgi:hypothetical protein